MTRCSHDFDALVVIHTIFVIMNIDRHCLHATLSRPGKWIRSLILYCVTSIFSQPLTNMESTVTTQFSYKKISINVVSKAIVRLSVHVVWIRKDEQLKTNLHSQTLLHHDVLGHVEPNNICQRSLQETKSTFLLR